MPFADLGLSNELLQAVEESGYSEPTPIQAQAIPSVLMMRDIIGIAQTGTGKTASFVLPMIDILAQGRSRARMPRSLILEPTRELAAQVAENFEKYGKYHKLSMALLIGGVSMGDQIKALEKGVDVLIATPGRLMDLFERGNILLTGCSLLVIDEADRMLDMGFIPDIENICTKLPANRQTLLFSATMPPPIKKLADRFLSNPKSIEVARPATAGANIAQMLVPVTERAKRETLRSLLKSEGAESAIVFCNRKTMVRELNKSLQRHGFRSGEIHGDIDQAARIAELDRFKSGEINLLIASDVAARGLDIKGVSHVFNFDAPWHPDDYVHRIGRTGRAGATGKAFTFITSSDAEAVANIEKLIGTKIPRLDMGGQTADEGEETESGRSSSRPAGKDSRKRTGRTAAPKRTRGASAASVADTASRSNADDDAATAGTERAAEPAPRETKPARKETARRPAEDRPARAPQAEGRTDARRGDSIQGRNRPDEEPDDGWNGPMPGFLSVGFTN
ncbi:MAG: DEAD/DEAH box helicase [Alphaproteobacteria bacterium]|nr:DEAD/DEAH box helicase [Alphaproteobacteria bacterium]MBU0794383.1 DEAD/DEAH box helicase [Alphaproteobacteria bacterium]MBU0874439.1 DEAD/DEAH box helicase [Alphaproteobacteria bacterium]MBU1768516.1 DEAD/DEAH box helicase [Alphaproteobacteria bacterium]